MDALPLTALFIDCDSFFASCEQQLRPELRGLPVGVAPVMAETSCCIAASYPAKRFGVKTGTRIAEARAMCPGIQIVEARPSEYVAIHHQVIAAVEDCIHVEAVLSIDEMWAWLPLNWREPEFLSDLVARIKQSIQCRVGEAITVSVGVGPNKYLAKQASKMRKPDGYFLIQQADLPQALHGLQLADLTGIGRSLELRLHAAGIHTVESLCAASRVELHQAWGSVLGERMWYLLRGVELPDMVSARQSIGHSHVLPPSQREPDLAWAIVCKLTHKACERLRSHALLTGSLTLNVAYVKAAPWSAELKFSSTDATLVVIRQLRQLWKSRPWPTAPLLQVGVVLGKLLPQCQVSPELPWLDHEIQGKSTEALASLDRALDELRQRYGRESVYLGAVHEARDQAPMRISFTHVPDLLFEE